MPAADAKEGSVAILLDFENAKDADLNRVLAEAARFGRVIVRRAYADWTRFAGQAGALREAGFEEVHQFTSGGRGKNATDINLVVDAMDLLYTRPVDTFVLVTADSDFAKLARRLREGGKRIVGLGARGRVGRALVQSCDEYIYYDVPEERPPKAAAGDATAAAKGKAPAKATAGVELGELHRIVLDALDAAADDEGKVYGGPLHEAIRRVLPDFSYRDYGFSSFRKMVESLAPAIRSKHAEDASDFIVWVAPEFEEVAREARRAPRRRHARERDTEKHAHEDEEDEEEDDETNGGHVLSEDVQRHIDRAWTEIAGGRKRLSGRRAAEAVSVEYGVTRLSDTPLGNLEGVLAASPWLARRWKRDGAWVVPRG